MDTGMISLKKIAAAILFCVVFAGVKAQDHVTVNPGTEHKNKVFLNLTQLSAGNYVLGYERSILKGKAGLMVEGGLTRQRIWYYPLINNSRDLGFLVNTRFRYYPFRFSFGDGKFQMAPYLYTGLGLSHNRYLRIYNDNFIGGNYTGQANSNALSVPLGAGAEFTLWNRLTVDLYGGYNFNYYRNNPAMPVNYLPTGFGFRGGVLVGYKF